MKENRNIRKTVRLTEHEIELFEKKNPAFKENFSKETIKCLKESYYTEDDYINRRLKNISKEITRLSNECHEIDLKIEELEGQRKFWIEKLKKGVNI